MDPEILDLMNQRYEELPQNVQKLLMAPRLRSSMDMIIKKHNVPEEKRILVENEVSLVLMCFEDKKDLEKNLVQEVFISEEVARSIVSDLEELVFSEVNDELSHAIEIQKNNEVGNPQNNESNTPEHLTTETNPKMRLQKLSTHYQPHAEAVPTRTTEEPSHIPEQNIQNEPTHMEVPKVVRAPENRWPSTIHQEHVGEVKEALNSMRGSSAASDVPNYSKPLTDTPKKQEPYQGNDPYHEPIE